MTTPSSQQEQPPSSPENNHISSPNPHSTDPLNPATDYDPTTTPTAAAANNGGINSYSDNIWPPYADPTYVMPSEISVHVNMLSNSYSFPVTIIKNTSSNPKPYYGGYKNITTQKYYHHASTQTPYEKKLQLKEFNNLRTRETQTFQTKSISIQPIREHGTQMSRIDLYLDSSKDVILTPKAYFTSEELMYLKREKCVEIQRVWRGYMARCRAIRIRSNIAEQEEKVLIAREIEEKEKQEERLIEMRKRTHPTTNADFSRLYNELDQWRRGEVVKIKARTKPGEERTQAMEALLQEETLALQNIQKLKTIAHHDTVVEKTQKMLELMAQPQKWQLSDGETAVVSTPATVRAKELLDLYNALNSPLVNTNARLEVLLNVKWTVKESISQAHHHSSGMTGAGAGAGAGAGHASFAAAAYHIHKEIMDLVDREADLLNRGRPYQSMSSLRKRISTLFLQFIENPLFNPRAAEFIHLPSSNQSVSEA